ncbi:MAG: DUF2242 domain-containing protein [Paucibacter sp.]|nr:DUF2242 domain-containing protein [Roseateles sp.]
MLSARFPLLVLVAALLAACSSGPGSSRKAELVYQNEQFKPDETFSRLFDASAPDICEAARRALLSQGYVISAASKGMVTGAKRFQPEGEVHVEISFNVVCVAEGKAGSPSTAFVSAQQDRYVIKRSSAATSIGVSAIGSISVPLSSQQDSMVKVASETIPAGTFYDRFFALMQTMLADTSDASEETRSSSN